MSYHPACSDFIDPETAEIARFGLTSLRASGAIFFWVDGPIGMADVELEGVNKQFFRDYASSMVNLDPLHTQSGWVQLDLAALGLEPQRSFQAHDLLSGSRFLWQGAHNYVALDPQQAPAHILRVRRHVRTERDFDYFL